MEEGYIKFDLSRRPAPAVVDAADLDRLNAVRSRLYERKLIGVYPDGIGYGNISWRNAPSPTPFLITGSATGQYPELHPAHIARVDSFDPAANRLHCTGPVDASSESMSHGVIYRQLPEVRAVIHIHSLPLWEALLWRVPTTPAEVTYGSPEMAAAIGDLLRDLQAAARRLFVTAGHREGIFAFGRNLQEAMVVVDQLTENG